MINIKSFHVIDKQHIKGNIHLVGCGALGSLIGQNLVRLNLGSKIIAYDFDVVEDKNLNNQAYLAKHVGQPKVEAFKDLSEMIDPESEIRVKNKKVEWLVTQDDDIIILAIDNFSARKSILEGITGTPLLISGGISSIGGNIEVVRGNYEKLASEYADIEGEPEYDENDLTPCGSPISIFHRINFAASVACDQLIQEHNREEDVYKNIVFDTPNQILMQV